MKISSRTTISFILVFLLSIITLSALSSAGMLRQTIYSPFETQIDIQEKGFNSERTSTPKPTFTTVSDRFRDFKVYSFDDAEPFCKVGGQYKANIYLDARGPGAGKPDDIESNLTKDLYYCKTTQDMLNRINLPSSWVDDNLLVYCNDGANIVDTKENFDYLTSRANTYKMCVVKNLDLNSNNTILYGYDVGNKIVDSDSSYFYDFETKKGPIVYNLDINFENGMDNSTQTVEEWVGEITIPWEESSSCYMDEPQGDSDPVEVCVTNYAPMSFSDAVEYAKSIDPQVTNLELITNSGVCKEERFGVDLLDICDANSVSYYYKMYTNSYSSGNMVYKDGLNSSYYLYYDTYSKFYSLKGFKETLEVPLKNIFTFPLDFEISRVALFKKINGRYIYGYEGTAKQKLRIPEFANSLKPEYTIKLKGYPGFTKSDCENTLAAFEQSNVGAFEFDVEVYCEGNDVIKIYADNLNNDKEEGNAFHLFKNIITHLGTGAIITTNPANVAGGASLPTATPAGPTATPAGPTATPTPVSTDPWKIGHPCEYGDANRDGVVNSQDYIYVQAMVDGNLNIPDDLTCIDMNRYFLKGDGVITQQDADAVKFATMWDWNKCRYGDANRDGVINGEDSLYVRSIAFNQIPEPADIYCADIYPFQNSIGNVTVTDDMYISTLLKWYADDSRNALAEAIANNAAIVVVPPIGITSPINPDNSPWEIGHPCMLGDANKDGSLNEADYNYVKGIVDGTISTPSDLTCIDMVHFLAEGDGSITQHDVEVVRFLLDRDRSKCEYGDANQDGLLNSADSTFVANIALEITPIPADPYCANVYTWSGSENIIDTIDKYYMTNLVKWYGD